MSTPCPVCERDLPLRWPERAIVQAHELLDRAGVATHDGEGYALGLDARLHLLIAERDDALRLLQEAGAVSPTVLAVVLGVLVALVGFTVVVLVAAMLAASA